MSRQHAYKPVFVMVALMFAVIEGLAQTGQGVPTPTPALAPLYRPTILAVTVNGLSGDPGVLFLENLDGGLFAPGSFLKDWNLRSGESRTIASDGVVYFDLARIQGVTYNRIDALGELAISASPDAFLPTRINIGASAASKLVPYAPGVYLHYDLSLTNSPGMKSAQGLFDIALFRGEGLLTSSFTAGNSVSGESGVRARLMTTWQTDRIDKLKTLRIGDSTNHTGGWGNGLLFGGIQYGTNFAVRPDFVTTAMPRVSGKALLPSTVDVYVNNVLRSRQQVGAGPFSIQNLPVVTGAGELQLVVKDLLGREQVITQPFFASPTVLREGLVDDVYEIGRLRENYGQKSNDYGDTFAAVTYRKGLTGNFTGEARFELQKDLAAAGLTAAVLLPQISSVVESSLVLSSAKGLSPGTMGSVSYSFLGKRLSASARLQVNSLAFRQIGSDPANLPRQMGALQISVPLGKGTLSANYLRRVSTADGLSRIINLGYSHRLSDRVFASVALIKPIVAGAVANAATVSATLTVLFDQQHIGSATVIGQPEGNAVSTYFQKSTPAAEGTGYRLAARNDSQFRRLDASVTRNQSFGTFQAEAAVLNDQTSSRLSAQGAVATLGNGLYFSRGMGEGFAIVQTGDLEGVPILVENQVVTRTNRNGRAMVGNLQPYLGNRISIDPLTLPMDASVGAVVKIVVPRNQGGVRVAFDVQRVRSATLTIVQADGSLLPPTTPVEVVGVTRAFVAGNRGEVSVELPGLKGNRVIARPERGPVCTVTVDLPGSDVDAPVVGLFLGPLLCKKSP
ncbi:fimbria/pilus outer membrane usher protein [Polaromonas sp.]|uniref:fimbria/pilus outer membrane usher protein n=1 Tax=Polaromonas sp. TaxID=1869339 RepID=UPI00356902D9